MYKFSTAVAIVVLAQTTAWAAEYRSDWNHKNFYEEITTCRLAVQLPAIQTYGTRAKQAGQNDEQIRNELISITPMLESLSSMTCYCAVNELAKDISYSSYKSDQTKIAGYINGVKCKAAVSDHMRSMTKDRANELKLK